METIRNIARHSSATYKRDTPMQYLDGLMMWRSIAVNADVEVAGMQIDWSLSGLFRTLQKTHGGIIFPFEARCRCARARVP
jgi:hypothetical protein